jgi:hypothetical protein
MLFFYHFFHSITEELYPTCFIKSPKTNKIWRALSPHSTSDVQRFQISYSWWFWKCKEQNCDHETHPLKAATFWLNCLLRSVMQHVTVLNTCNSVPWPWKWPSLTFVKQHFSSSWKFWCFVFTLKFTFLDLTHISSHYLI